MKMDMQLMPAGSGDASRIDFDVDGPRGPGSDGRKSGGGIKPAHGKASPQQISHPGFFRSSRQRSAVIHVIPCRPSRQSLPPAAASCSNVLLCLPLRSVAVLLIGTVCIAGSGFFYLGQEVHWSAPRPLVRFSNTC